MLFRSQRREPGQKFRSGKEAHLVELVPVGEDDRVGPHLGEHGLAHLPPPVLFDRPHALGRLVVQNRNNAGRGRKVVLKPGLAVVRDKVRVREVDDCLPVVSAQLSRWDLKFERSDARFSV